MCRNTTVQRKGKTCISYYFLVFVTSLDWFNFAIYTGGRGGQRKQVASKKLRASLNLRIGTCQ